MTDSFAHAMRLDQIRDGERLDLKADDAERHAVAERLGLAAIERLEAHAVLTRSGDQVRVEGRLRARLDQSCVVTGEPVPATIDEPFALMFMPAPTDSAPDEEMELGEEDCDVVFYDGAQLDVGSAIADTLALSVNPYPRSAGAELALKEAGVLSEEQAGPFAALAALKKGNDS